MGSIYLKPADYMLYDVDPVTTVSDVIVASEMIDTYIDRPEGLIYVSDIDGNPCYMAALNPSRSFVLSQSIAAGVNIAVPLPANFQLANPIGEPVVLDRDNALMEICRIVAADATSITLATVVRPHSSGTKAEFGLVNSETRSLPAKRSVARVARFPLERLVSGAGRYEYGRRSDQYSGVADHVNLLAIAATFGGPPIWNPFDPKQCDTNRDTGEIWIPAGMLVAYYTQVKLWYVSGFLETQLPRVIKTICARLIKQKHALPEEMTGNVSLLKAGDTEIRRFKDQFLDLESKSQLREFKVRAMY